MGRPCKLKSNQNRVLTKGSTFLVESWIVMHQQVPGLGCVHGSTPPRNRRLSGLVEPSKQCFAHNLRRSPGSVPQFTRGTGSIFRQEEILDGRHLRSREIYPSLPDLVANGDSALERTRPPHLGVLGSTGVVVLDDVGQPLMRLLCCRWVPQLAWQPDVEPLNKLASGGYQPCRRVRVRSYDDSVLAAMERSRAHRQGADHPQVHGSQPRS